MNRQYTAYIKEDAIIRITYYLATWPVTTETCSQILPNCNYCILFDVCCVLTVHNILYKSDNSQRDGLSISLKKQIKSCATNPTMDTPPTNRF